MAEKKEVTKTEYVGTIELIDDIRDTPRGGKVINVYLIDDKGERKFITAWDDYARGIFKNFNDGDKVRFLGVEKEREVFSPFDLTKVMEKYLSTNEFYRVEK